MKKLIISFTLCTLASMPFTCVAMQQQPRQQDIQYLQQLQRNSQNTYQSLELELEYLKEVSEDEDPPQDTQQKIEQIKKDMRILKEKMRRTSQKILQQQKLLGVPEF